MRKIFISCCLVPAFLAIVSCNMINKKKVDSPNGYDLGSPEKFLMPESLFEISGISFHNGKPDSIYAIQDEEGKFFRLAWGVKKQAHTKFGKKGDYEDVTVFNEQAIILKSNGVLYRFPFAERYSEEIDSAQEWRDILPEGEYEGMYGDDSTGKLYVLCKNCKSDEQKKSITGYILDPGDSIRPAGTFTIDVAAVKAASKEKLKGPFRPSAIAKNPKYGHWYILSSVNKALVVTDKNFTVIQTIDLNGNTFSQPEGLAFDNDGNMYISNEGDDLTQGNILKFIRKAK